MFVNYEMCIVIHRSDITLKPIAADVNNVQFSVGKPLILAFIWMSLDTNHLPQHPCRQSSPFTSLICFGINCGIKEEEKSWQPNIPIQPSLGLLSMNVWQLHISQ